MGFALTLLYLAFTLLRPQELFPELVGYQVMDVLAGLALAGTMLSLTIGDRPRLPVLQTGLVIGFVLWAAASVVIVLRWFGGALLAFDSLSINAFVFVLIILNVSTRRRLKVVAAVLVALVIGLLGMGLFSYFAGWRADQFVLFQSVDSGDPRLYLMEGTPPAVPGQGQDSLVEPEEDDVRRSSIRHIKRLRSLGFLNDPNDLAQMVIVALPFSLLPFRRRRPFRNLAVVGFPVGFLLSGLFLTASRGGLVALTALVWAAFAGRFRGRTSLSINLVGVLLLSGFLVVSGRLGQLDGSAEGRVEAWSEGLQMLKASPIWGMGYGMFIEEHERVAHNSFVHVLSELGVVGYFLWLGALVVTFAGLARLRALGRDERNAQDLRSLASATRLALIGFLAAGMFLSRAYSVTLFIVLGIATALIGVGLKRRLLAEAPFALWVPATVALQAFTVVLVYATVVLAR